MNIIARNGICLEVLEKINDVKFIVRGSSNDIVLYDSDRISFFSLNEVIRNYNKFKTQVWRSESYRQRMIRECEEVIKIIKMLKRDDSIDEIFGNVRPNSITGMTSLALAC